MNFRSYEVYSHVRSYLNVVVFLNVRQSLPKYIRYCQGRVKRTDQQSICFFFSFDFGLNRRNLLKISDYLSFPDHKKKQLAALILNYRLSTV